MVRPYTHAKVGKGLVQLKYANDSRPFPAIVCRVWPRQTKVLLARFNITSEPITESHFKKQLQNCHQLMQANLCTYLLGGSCNFSASRLLLKTRAVTVMVDIVIAKMRTTTIATIPPTIAPVSGPPLATG